MAKPKVSDVSEVLGSMAQNPEQELTPQNHGDIGTEVIMLNGKRVTMKAVRLPQSKFEENVPKYLRIISAIVQSRVREGTDTARKPADVCSCEDLNTGMHVEIIVGTVLKNILDENYPDAAYVGKAFEIIQGAKTGKQVGKEWRAYSVKELHGV
jgi:hypothetical protein